MNLAARSLSIVNAIIRRLFRVQVQVKDEISKTGRRALGIDDLRYKLERSLERLSRLDGIENRLDGIERQLVTLRERFDRRIAQEQPNQPFLDDALRRLRGHAIEIASLVDVGAASGFWSKAFARYFPDRRHLLIDANPVHLPELTRLCEEQPNWDFVLTAVGAANGEFYFDASEPLGGHLSKHRHNENYRPCPVTTIDNLVEERRLTGPFVIKLDTHGVEIPILTGAAKTLKETSAIVIEAYNFSFGEPAVPFWELCRYMFELGFRPLDVFDLLYRDADNAFWQFDLLFVPSDLPLFKNIRYSG